MLLEASHLLNGSVVDVRGVKHGRIDHCIYTAESGRLAGFQVAVTSVMTKFRALSIQDCLSLNHEHVVIDSPDVLSKDLKELDTIAQLTGKVVGVAAATESGTSLGHVSDVLLDADTGVIVRLYIRKLLAERIIPREYLVSITPKRVVFKDVVNTPVFTQIASAELPAT